MEVSGHHLQMALQIMLVILHACNHCIHIIVLLQISDLYLANIYSPSLRHRKTAKKTFKAVFFKEL